MRTSILRKLSLLALLAFGLLSIIATGGGDDGTGSISILSPAENATVSGETTVSGSCSVVDQLTVVLDNDAFSRQVVACRSGHWSAAFDTTRFQDGEHALVAYASDTVRDQIQITTSNGNLDGFTVTVPVSLADGLYDEIDPYTPLFVYAKRVTTGLVVGQRFTTGTFPGEFAIPNVPDGVYQIGAFLDRNTNLVPDAGWDFEGTAGELLEVSNGDATSGNVELTLFDGDFDHDGAPDAGGSNPADVYGQLVIEQPADGAVVSGTLQVVVGLTASNADWVTVSIDGNRYTAQAVDVSGVGTSWEAQFDTTRLQDGEHVVRAELSDEIWDQVFFTTDNGNVQGYTVRVNVDLAEGLSDEIDDSTVLYVYVQDPVTGARQTARFTSGGFGPDSAFEIRAVPNNTYRVGAFLDRNGNGVEDGGDYAGQADELLTVWYADATADVVLLGNEVEITTPAPFTEIRANYIDLAGTYTFDPDEITVLMRLNPASYRTTEAAATFADGEWSARLDITDVTQEGQRQVYVRARYGVRYAGDTVFVDIDRDFPRGVAITEPEDGASVVADALTVTGTYDGDPLGIAVSLEDGAGGALDGIATFANGSWSVLLDDITGVVPGVRTLTATADYGGAIEEQDVIQITISEASPVMEVAITSPLDGATVDSTTLLVQGTYTGVEPDSVSVSIETDDGGGTLEVAAEVDTGAGTWSATFDDLAGAVNGQRVITAVADYGGGETATDSITVNVDLPATGKSFTYRLVVSAWASEARGVTWMNTIPDCPHNVPGPVSLPWSRTETVELPFSPDPPPADTWCQGPFNEVRIGASTWVDGEDATIRVYLNGSNAAYHTATAYQNPYLEISASWDGDPDHAIVFQRVFP